MSNAELQERFDSLMELSNAGKLEFAAVKDFNALVQESIDDRSITWAQACHFAAQLCYLECVG